MFGWSKLNIDTSFETEEGQGNIFILRCAFYGVVLICLATYIRCGSTPSELRTTELYANTAHDSHGSVGHITRGPLTGGCTRSVRRGSSDAM